MMMTAMVMLVLLVVVVYLHIKSALLHSVNEKGKQHDVMTRPDQIDGRKRIMDLVSMKRVILIDFLRLIFY